MMYNQPFQQENKVAVIARGMRKTYFKNKREHNSEAGFTPTPNETHETSGVIAMEKSYRKFYYAGIEWLSMSRWVRGFTLIEVMVALSIFVVAVSIAISGFLTVLRTDNEIGNFIRVETNTELAIEQMAREIRTGRNFGFIGSDLEFTNAYNADVFYCQRTFGGVGSLLRTTGSDAGCSDPANKITADDVHVSFLSFTHQFGGASLLPDRITIALTVASIVPTLTIPPVNLETTVSARNF